MISNLFKQAAKFASDNSPAILTGIGVAGTVATAVLAGRGATQAQRILDDYDMGLPYKSNDPPLTRKEQFKLVWQCYIPAASIGTGTIIAIVMANKIGSKRTAAMTAAFTLSEKMATEYSDKVREHIGKTKERRVRDEIAQDQINRNPPPNSVLIVTGEGEPCYDSWSGRWFTSTMETIKKAQNDLNYRVVNDGYATLTDFYDLLGLESIQESDDLGWNTDKLLELEFSTCLTKDQKPAHSIRYRVTPTRDFDRFR